VGVAGCCWALLSVVGRCWVLDVGGGCWALLGDVGCCWALLGVVGHCWLLLGIVGLGAVASVEVAGTSYFHTPYAPTTGRGTGENNEWVGSTITASMRFSALQPFSAPAARGH